MSSKMDEELNQIYNVLSEELLEDGYEDLALGRGKNYSDAKNSARKELPDNVNLDKTEIVELTPEGEDVKIVAYKYRKDKAKELYNSIKRMFSSIFTSSQNEAETGQKAETGQIEVDGQIFDLEMREAKDEYYSLPSLHLDSVDKYLKIWKDSAGVYSGQYAKEWLRERLEELGRSRKEAMDDSKNPQGGL